MKYSFLFAPLLASLALNACTNKAEADSQQSSATTPDTQNAGASNPNNGQTQTPNGATGNNAASSQGMSGSPGANANGSNNSASSNASDPPTSK